MFNPYAIGVGEKAKRLPRTPMALRLTNEASPQTDEVY
jgi:hypothetical protein